MISAEKHITLGRRFAEIGSERELDTAAENSFLGGANEASDGIVWDDIFSDGHNCVILGEAGSGKSAEMKNQCHALRNRNQTAAYIDLVDALQRGTPTLSRDEVQLLGRWRRSSSSAWFFLDSVDESKLTKVTDFERALRCVRSWLGEDLERARFVISSRISEWRPTNDLRIVRELLTLRDQGGVMQTPEPGPSTVRSPESSVASRKGSESKDANRVRVLTLRPLTTEQAKAYLAGKGIKDAGFWNAVDDGDAWSFMSRPLDVDGMNSLWKQKGRLGSWQEIVEARIQHLLEDPRDRSSLPHVRMREGAEHLAACMAMGKCVSVALDETTPIDLQGTLTLQDALPHGWSSSDRGELLQRPLFAPAVYGKLRFHHRAHQDYLAACWLAKVMRQDCPHSELQHLLFARRADALILRPALTPVAAWLATVHTDNANWQKRHREDLLRAAPWVFFTHGDPRSLPHDYKAEVLRQTAERFKGRNHVRIDWDAATLKRFADPGLAEQVSQWIADSSVPTDVRADYVALVQYGDLREATPTVADVAIDGVCEEHLRACALLCLSDIGSDIDRLRILAAFASPQTIPLRLGVQLVRMAYPRVIDGRGLFELLGRLEVAKATTRSSSLYTLDHFFSHIADASRASAALRELCAFLVTREGKFDEERTWAHTWLKPLLAAVLEAPQLTTQAEESALLALDLLEQSAEQQLIDSFRINDASKNVAEQSLRHPCVRRAWFWRQVARRRNQDGTEPQHRWDIEAYHSPIKIHPQDLAWWMSDVRERDDVHDRLFALRMSLDLSGRIAGRRTVFPPLRIVRAGLTSGALRTELLLHVKASLLMPWNQLRSAWKQKFSRPSFVRRALQPIRKRYFKYYSLVRLWLGRERMERGQWWNGVWFVIDQARRKVSASQWGDHDLNNVKTTYGSAVVRCAMAGADKHWRQHRPPLPSEKPERNQTNASTILGLVALRAAWNEHDAGYFYALSDSEAELAARYALDELNVLPPWFGTLLLAHPGPTSAVVAAEMKAEWLTIPADAQSGSAVLGRFVYFLPDIPRGCIVDLRELLLGSAPSNLLVLSDALQLAQRLDSNCAQWLVPRAMVALEGVSTLTEVQWPWLIAAMTLDADRAFAWLKDYAKAMSFAERRRLAESLCAGLLNRRSRNSVNLSSDYLRARFLRHFLPWVMEHVRPEDDVPHDGVYTPGARDDAEDFRRVLTSCLESDHTSDASTILAELAIDPSMHAYRDYLLGLIDRRRAREADNFRIEAVDVAAILTEHERVPRNRADLFHTADMRLRGFKERVESAENTTRHEAQQNWQEPDYQAWLQRHLQQVAKNKYTVPREVEVDPGNFPDLRFESPLVDGAVQVEVKVATFDHWSYRKLKEHLHQQLVGKYLRAGNAVHGVYLLFRAKRNRRWEMDDGTALDWDQMLNQLREQANLILAQRPDIERLEVIGVDVTPPEL
jgi:hypothetical protein